MGKGASISLAEGLGDLRKFIAAAKAAGELSVADGADPHLVIYAVRPFHWKEQFPEVNMLDPDHAASIRKKWSDKLPFLAKPRLS
jgi:hypothetical protein